MQPRTGTWLSDAGPVRIPTEISIRNGKITINGRKSSYNVSLCDNVDYVHSYLYWLITSQDANFRYKGRHRDTKVLDVSLSPGWAYFVEHDEYIKHISKYANQEEVSLPSLLK